MISPVLVDPVGSAQKAIEAGFQFGASMVMPAFEWKNRENVDKLYENTTGLFGDIGLDKEQFAEKLLDAGQREKFFKNVSEQYDVGSLGDFEKVLLNDIQSIDRPDLPVKTSSGSMAAASSGLEQSVPGLIARGEEPEIFQPRGFKEKVIQAGAMFGADIVPFTLGSMIFRSPAGGMGLTEAMRSGLMRYYEKKAIEGESNIGLKDYVEIVTKGLHDGIIAAASGQAGAFAGKVAPTAMKIPAIVGTMTATSSVFHNEVPTMDDFLINGMLLGGAHLGHVFAGLLRNLYRRTGVRPKDLNIENNQEGLRKIFGDEELIKNMEDLEVLKQSKKGFVFEEELIESLETLKDFTKGEKATVRRANESVRKVIEQVRGLELPIMEEGMFPAELERLQKGGVTPEAIQVERLKLQELEAARYETKRLIDESHRSRESVRGRAKERKGSLEDSPVLAELQGHFVEVLTNSVKAVHELLGGDRLGVVPQAFSEQSYKQAKPYFEKAWNAAKAAGRSLPEFMLEMEQRLGENYVPYLDKWRQDVSNLGTGNLTNAGHESIAERKGVLGDLNRMLGIAEKWKNKLADAIDTEAPFNRIGAPNTAHAVRIAPTRTELVIENGYRLLNRMIYGDDFKFGKKKVLTKDDLSNIPLVRDGYIRMEELPKAQQERISGAVKSLDEFFDAAQRKYSEYGVDVDFVGHLRSQLLEKLHNTKNMKMENRIAIEEGLKFLENKKFVHIPLYLWFGNEVTGKNAGRFSRALKIMNSQKRKTWSIGDLLEEQGGPLKLSDINVADIVMSYSKRLGRDFALLEILKGAQKDNIAFGKGEFFEKVKSGEIQNPESFVDHPLNAPIFKGFKIHRQVAQWAEDMSRLYSNWGWFNKTLSTVKMGTFANPIFLPAVDMMQSVYGTQLRSLGPRNVRKSFNDVLKRSTDYQRAMFEGLASKPEMHLPWKVFEDKVNGLKQTPVERAFETISLLSKFKGEGFKRLFTNPLLIRSAYNASFNIAWTLDEVVRMMDYNWARSKGFSERKAAEFSSKIHSQYDSVPAKTRKALNVPFFTPTFKITMGKWFYEMMKSSVEVGLGKAQGKTETARMKKLYAGGLISAIITTEAIDLLMTEFLPFQRDEWGRKYYMKTKSGEEIAIPIYTPMNLMYKFVTRAIGIANDPAVDNKLLSYISANKWEIQPVWRILTNMAMNRDDHGRPIYSEGDSDAMALGKRIKYTMFSAFQMMKHLETDPYEKETRKILNDEFGTAVDLVFRVNPFASAYKREPEVIRKYARAKAKSKRMVKELLQGTITNEKQLKKFLEDIEKTLEE